MDDLPRDVQLEIIKRFDIDTRIKTGVIFKIRVPDNMKTKMKMLHAWKTYVDVTEGHCFLREPYNTYLSSIDQYEGWLEHWYANEWPIWYKILNSPPKYEAIRPEH